MEMKLSQRYQKTRTGAHGFVLLEALIAILIFSLGILALVGMQATAMKFSVESKYRADASFLVNKLIAQMWADDPSTLVANYASAGPKFIAWKTELNSALSGLPDATADIDITDIPAPQGKRVTVTLSWRHPQDPSTQKRRYVTVAQIPVNPP